MLSLKGQCEDVDVPGSLDMQRGVHGGGRGARLTHVVDPLTHGQCQCQIPLGGAGPELPLADRVLPGQTHA